jgi:hypothetical protein
LPGWHERFFEADGTPGSLVAVRHFFEPLPAGNLPETQLSNVEAKYRALVEQLPAVVFMAYLDRDASGAYHRTRSSSKPNGSVNGKARSVTIRLSSGERRRDAEHYARWNWL